MMSVGRLGLTEEQEITKQPVSRKHLMDEMTDFHGFITPGGKLSSQRLEDECSTALPSQCTTGSLESLPTTPAGWGTLLPPPEPRLFHGWQAGAHTWCPGNLGVHSDFGFLDHEMEVPDIPGPFEFRRSVAELDDALSALIPDAFEPSAFELATPPSTPRQKRTADRTCPLAPCPVSKEGPILWKALQKNDLDLVMNALESDPDSARIPFWDYSAEPPLCAAIRMRCGIDIVDLLLKSGANVKSENFAGLNPLDLLSCATFRTVASDEIEELLLGAGAELSENSAKLSQEEDVMGKDAFRWDAFAGAGTLCDFGLPPSLGGSLDFFDLEPPPPVNAVAC